MATSFASVIGKGFGNILLNGFASDLPHKTSNVSLDLKHFNPFNDWERDEGNPEFKPPCIRDKATGEEYCDDLPNVVRAKCAALFGASLVVQPIGLTLNLLNRIGKIVTFAHLWNPSQENYCFKARLVEGIKDILIVAFTALILVGMVLAALYGVISPYNGRKLYGTLERLAYSGGYEFFKLSGVKSLTTFLLAPCFQPQPKVHLGGGNINESNVW